MGSKYTKCFEPITIKGVEFKNRIICTPHVCGYGSREGILTAEQSAFYERIASGGPAYVTLGNCSVNMLESSDEIHQLNLADDKVIFGLNTLRDRVARNGAHLSAQINYCGRNGNWPGSLHYAPTALPTPGQIEIAERTHTHPQEVIELTTAKIHELVELYANAAFRLKRAGFKMLQVHCAHNNLIGQFFSPISNFRTDEYGIHSMENRTRFGREVLQAIRDKVGDEMVIDIRMSGEDVMPGGMKRDDAIEVAKVLEPYVDIMTISNAFHQPPSYIAEALDLSYFCPQTPLKEYTRGFRDAIKNAKLVFTTDVVDLDNAEQILQEGLADFVGMFRPFLADPDIVKKYSRDKPEEVIPCIRCEYHFRFGQYLPITCAVNPKCGHEWEFPGGVLPKTDDPKHVLIVGAGPGGIQAAITATERGHKVTLAEASDHLGGNLIKAADLDHKPEFKKYVKWLLPKVEACGADIQLNTEVDAKYVKKLNPDVLIIAAGTRDIVPRIPGVDKDHVHLSWEADARTVKVGKKVVIIGAGMVGMESALQLSREGKDVTVVEMLPEAASTMAKGALAAPVIGHNRDAGTKVLYESQVVDIKDKAVTVTNQVTGQSSELKADTVLLAVGVSPKKDVVEELRHVIAEGDIYIIGDLTDDAGTIGRATNTGFEVAAHI